MVHETSEFSSFSTETTKFCVYLEAFDCYKLANNSVHVDLEYDMAYFWAQKALQLLESDSKYLFVDRKQVYAVLAQAARMVRKQSVRAPSSDLLIFKFL